MSYLEFESNGLSKSGLTHLWKVKSRDDEDLGQVAWYSHWRKYCFYVICGSVLDAGCLIDIADFCEEQTKEHNARRNVHSTVA